MISINNKKLKTILLIVGGSLLMCSLALSTGFLLNYAAQPKPTAGTPCTQSYIELIQDKTQRISVDYWASDTYVPSKGYVWSVDVVSNDKEYESKTENTDLCAALDEAWNKLNAYDAFIQGQKQ